MSIDKEAIERWYAGREDELIDAVSRLVRIDSTLGPAEPGKPFGPGPAAALDEALALAREWGLTAEGLEGYVGVVDLGDGPTELHILGHLDVVPPGEGWTVTEAFTPRLVDGLLYGRGTDDDKGPMAAVLLAMRAVKELGAPLRRSVRAILGTDEETGFRDIHWYYERHPYAPCTFSPDAGFPILNIEKGHYQPTLRASWQGETALPRVTAAQGGVRVNVVPAKATATVAGLDAAAVRAAADALALGPAIQFAVTEGPDGVQLVCSGQPTHASTPEEGHNAQTALVALLAALPLADCASTRAIRALARWFPHGDHTGAALGIAQRDDLSGNLSLAFTCLALDADGVTARFDARTPLCGSDESIRLPVERTLGADGLTVSGTIDPPHHVPADSPFLRTLARCYEEWTGLESSCRAIGGGTYVHGIPGGVAFGASMPGFVSNLHSPDERVCVADLLTASKIFAQVILDVCS